MTDVLGELRDRVGELSATLSPLTATEKLLHPQVVAPIHAEPVTTALLRNGVTFGLVITPALEPAPTNESVQLGPGTLWFDPKLLGAAFAGASGWVGVPFASAGLEVSGAVQFSAGEIALDASSTLAFVATSSTTQAQGTASGPIGADARAAKLTPFPSGRFAFAPDGASIELVGDAKATLLGQALDFATGPASEAVSPDLPTPCVAVPCQVSQSTFSVGSSQSGVLLLSGHAAVSSGAVAFPIVDAQVDDLPQPVDAWGLIVALEAGLSAKFCTLKTPAPLADASLALLPTRLVGRLKTSATPRVDRYGLWQRQLPAAPSATEPELALPPATVAVELPGGSNLAFVISDEEEAVILLGLVDAVLSRPVAADGSRVPLKGPGALARVLTAAGTSVEIAANLPEAPATALAAENALIPVAAPEALVILGRLQSITRIVGRADISFPTATLVPTLPDPYAAQYALSRDGLDELVVTVGWTSTGPPEVALRIVSAARPEDVVDAEPGVIEGMTLLEQGLALATLAEQGAVERGRASVGFALLDISTNADLWGVAMASRGATLEFDGLRLTASDEDPMLFAVPGISWEPIVDKDAEPPDWLSALSPDDGTPTIFLVSSQKPTPLIPVTALEAYAADAGSVPTEARFTLPFGITANLVDGPDRSATLVDRPDRLATAPSYEVIGVDFADANMRAARSLVIVAAGDKGTATLPGSAQVGYDDTDPAHSAYGALVLGVNPQPNAPPQPGKKAPTPARFWDEQFATGKATCIPVERVDLGGYGTSAFSDWHDPDAEAIGVVRASFNILLGRAAHELVQFQTWVLPWSIRLQRTVVFDREDAGEVLKHDSGWQPVGDARFELLDQGTLMSGPVERLTAIRNIVIPGEEIDVGAETYARVTFDADVVFDSSLHVAADGKDPAATAVGSGIVGYASTTVGPPPTPAEVIALMQQIGVARGTTRLTGTTGCLVSLGSGAASRFTMSVTSFGAALAHGTKPKLQVGLFGSPHLPKDGQWSIAKRSSGDARPEAVDSGGAVPLTRGGASSQAPPAGGSYAQGWRILDPEDAQVVDSPSTFYGLLQGTGTSKTLLEHPLVRDDGQALGFGHKPNLADVGALLGVGGLFPDLDSALEIPSTDDLPLHGDGFQRTYEWPINEPERSLLDLAIVHLVLVYKSPDGTSASGKLVLDATPNAPNWSLRLANLSFEARVDGFGTLLTIAGDFQAGSATKPGFVGLSSTTTPPPAPQLSVIYGEALSAVEKLFSGLSQLATSLGGDADLEVGFSGQQLSVKQGFTLPTLPLGFGEVTHLGIDLGCTATIPTDLAFHVGIGSRDDPFEWVVDPLAGTGAIELGVDHGALDVYIEAGLGLGLAIDVVVASGSASIVISLSIAIGDSEVTVGVMLTGNADVDVLGGVASACLTLCAGVAIAIPEPPPFPPTTATVAGDVAVGIHISVCWVISLDFDGSWAFSETMSL